MKKEADQKQEIMKITVNGKCITLFFMPEPNHDAAEFIKKTLLNAYLIKAV